MRHGMYVCLCLSFFGTALSSIGRADDNTSENALPSDDSSFEPALFERVKRYMDISRPHLTNGGKIGGTIAITGGFHSCFSTNVQIMERGLPFLWSMAAKGVYYRLVINCFTRSSKDIYFFTTSQPERVWHGGYDDYAAAIVDEANKAVGLPTYLIGHSYGGWLTMRTALHLPASVRIGGVVTLDPISTTHCKPSAFIGSYLSSTFGVNPHPDCTRAPRDFTAADKDAIKERSGWWLNVYQDNSILLHSSPISQAINYFEDFNYTGIFELAFGHADVAVSNDAWAKIEAKVYP